MFQYDFFWEDYLTLILLGKTVLHLTSLCFREKISSFLIIQERSYPGVIYCQDHYVFKTVSSPGIEENMCGVIESADLMDKYAVADQRNYGKVVGHLPMGKTGKFAKAIFNFLKKDKKHFCRLNVPGKATSAGNRWGMKVPYCRGKIYKRFERKA